MPRGLISRYYLLVTGHVVPGRSDFELELRYMTADEAAEIAGRKARELNMPWGPHVEARRMWRFWPLPGTWRVVSRVPAELAETTILVNERSREAYPRSVRHALRFGADGAGKA